MSSPFPEKLPAGVTRGLAEPMPAPAPPAESDDIPLEVHVSGQLPSGLDATLIYRGSARQLAKVLRQVERAGLVPAPRDFVRTAEGLPICPRHRIIMRERDKQGDRWYSHNVGSKETPLWCRGHAGPDSPGWDAPAEGRGA